LFPIHLSKKNEIGNDQQNRANDIYERHHPGNTAVDFVAEQMKNNRRPKGEENEDENNIQNGDDGGHRLIIVLVPGDLQLSF
jgi:hypothetical protein